MNMKKLMSICAMSLAITCCTSISTFAAEKATDNKNRNEVIGSIAVNFYKGGQVVNNLPIYSDKTPISAYFTKTLIDEVKGKNIAPFDESKSAKENFGILMSEKNKYTSDENLKAIKSFVDEKLDEFIEADKAGNLDGVVKKYLKADSYGRLTTGKNMDGKSVVSLLDRSGNVILQISSENVYSVKNELKGVNSWTGLKAVLGNYGLMDIFK